MSECCAVCGQPLPEGLDAAEMHRRLEKLGAMAAEREVNKLRRQLDQEHRVQLAEQAEAIRKVAAKKAQASSRLEIKSLRRRLDAAARRIPARSRHGREASSKGDSTIFAKGNRAPQAAIN
jgi:DNA repair exonuclease SbcCD ATPase subunit